MGVKRIVLAIAAVAVVAGIVAGALLLFGQGGLSPEEAMAETIKKVEALTSYRMKGTAEIETMGQSMNMDMDGVASTGENAADTRFSMLATMDVLGQSIEMDERLVDGRIYIKYEPDITGAETPQWYYMDFDVAAMQGASTGNVNPTDYLSYMKAFSSVEDAGRQEVGGVECDHYILEIDMSKISDMALENAKTIQASASGEDVSEDQLAQMRELYENMSMTLELFIGVDDKLPHREIVDMTVTDPVPMTMKMTMDFSDFNTPVEIDAPEGAVPFPADSTGAES